MTFEEELEILAKEAGINPASSSSSTNKMTKSQFMSRYINDMYKKRYRDRHNEAETYLIEAAISKRVEAEKRSRKGVRKYAER